MSKTKRKEHSEGEYLKGQIRKLESENRQLRKRVRALDKKAHFYQDLVDDVTEDIEIKDICPSCRKGQLIILDLKYVKYQSCDNDQCEYRKKL